MGFHFEAHGLTLIFGKKTDLRFSRPKVKIMCPRGTHIYFKLLCPKYSIYYALLDL